MEDSAQFVIELFILSQFILSQFIIYNELWEKANVWLVDGVVCLRKVYTMTSAPSVLFIIPYRDRQEQLSFFKRHMKYILSDSDESYHILVVHQNDTRPFNRGAMKNIGAIYAKQKWPDAYPTMTLVFNDVDVAPLEKGLISYSTLPSIVKHFYGFTYTLGGIVSIRGADFERMRGFPNLWAWGFEDNVMQVRCETARLNIDRSTFYPIMDKRIIHLQDGFQRQISRREFDISISKHADTVFDIRNVQWNEETEGEGEGDVSQLNVYSFDSKFAPPVAFDTHDLRKGNTVFDVKARKVNLRGKMW